MVKDLTVTGGRTAQEMYGAHGWVARRLARPEEHIVGKAVVADAIVRRVGDVQPVALAAENLIRPVVRDRLDQRRAAVGAGRKRDQGKVRADMIQPRPHVQLTLAEDQAAALRDALTRWLG